MRQQRIEEEAVADSAEREYQVLHVAANLTCSCCQMAANSVWISL